MTVSQWCQRWSDGVASYRWAEPGDRFDARRYEVHPIAETTSKAYILSNHYSGSYPNAKRRFGLFRDGSLVGVAVYSIPTQAAVLTNALPDLAPYEESVELGRLVIADPEPGNTESWFVARCHGELLAQGFRGVVSFSDPVPRVVQGRTVMPGHVGYIYQALGAVYTGRSGGGPERFLRDGMTLSDRARSKVRKQDQGHRYAEQLLVSHGARPMRAGEDPAAWLRQAELDAGVTTVSRKGKHRYVFPLGTNRRQRDRIRIGLPTGAYPKQIDAPITIGAGS